jgi:hypothetical protein
MRLLAGVLAFAACGSDKEPPLPAPPPPPAEAAVAAVDAAVPVAAPDGPAADDSCTISASGAMNFEQTTPGGRAAVVASYWFKKAERKKLMDSVGFAVTCNGERLRFSIYPAAAIAMEPKVYKLDRGKGDLRVVATLNQRTFSNATGTVEVTAFDTRHVAGTFKLTGTVRPGGELELKGSFDLRCPGYSGCGK